MQKTKNLPIFFSSAFEINTREEPLTSQFPHHKPPFFIFRDGPWVCSLTENPAERIIRAQIRKRGQQYVLYGNCKKLVLEDHEYIAESIFAKNRIWWMKMYIDDSMEFGIALGVFNRDSRSDSEKCWVYLAILQCYRTVQPFLKFR